MSNVLKQTIGSKVFKETSVLTKGVIIGNLITTFGSLAIARLFSPAEIGYISIFNSIVFILSSTVTLGFDQAIIVAKSDKEKSALTTLSELLLVAGSFVVLIICLMAYYFDVNTGIDIPKQWLLYIPLGMLFLGGVTIYNSWFVDQKEYKLASNNRIIISSVTTLLQISFGFFGFTFWGLLIGYIGGRAASFFHFLKHLYSSFIRVFTPDFLKNVIKKFQKYPKYVTPTLLIDRISIEAPFFLIAFYFFSNDVGYYAIAYRALSVPLSFIGIALGQILFKNFSLLIQRSKPMLNTLTKNWLILAAIGGIPTLIVTFFGEWLFPFVFGDAFSVSGSFAILLAPLLFLDFISSPTGKTFLILNLEHYTTVFSTIRLILIVLSFYVGYMIGDIYLSLFLYAITRSIGLIVQNIILYAKIKEYDFRISTDHNN